MQPFASNHSKEIQQSHFVSKEAKRVQALEALTNYQRTFSQFCQITGYMEFTTHMARKIFASWVTGQKSARLSECAAFAANHSVAIQQSHYVSNEAKRVQAMEALTFYQRTIVGEVRTKVNPEYQQSLKEDLAAVADCQWKEALEREQ